VSLGLPAEVGEALGLVLEEESFEDAADDFFLVVSELGNGLELKSEVVVGSALLLVEEKQICADA
jgi:hypothetical protein